MNKIVTLGGGCFVLASEVAAVNQYDNDLYGNGIVWGNVKSAVILKSGKVLLSTLTPKTIVKRLTAEVSYM